MKENWTYKKVKEVCKKASSNIVLNKIEDNTGDFPLYGASGFVKGVDFYHRDEPYIGIVKDGSGVGRVDVYPAKSSLVGTMQYILPQKECSLKYLCYALQGLNLSQFVNGAAIPHIYFRDYGECTIPVPPIETQSRIVSELDLLQSIIDKQKAQLKELDNLAQAVFYDMFGDPVENDKGWETAELNDVCDVRDGTHDSPSYYEDGYPLITSKNVIDGKISFEDVNYISKEDFDNISKRSRVDDGDIIMPMIGTIGKPVVVKKDREFAIKNVALIKFFSDSKVANVYIQAIMSSRAFDTYMKSKNRGGNQKFIALGDIRKLKVSVPPLSLQQSFAAKIEAIERQKTAIGKCMAETKKLFDYSMDKYFG